MRPDYGGLYRLIQAQMRLEKNKQTLDMRSHKLVLILKSAPHHQKSRHQSLARSWVLSLTLFRKRFKDSSSSALCSRFILCRDGQDVEIVL